MVRKKRLIVVNDNADFLVLMSDFLAEEGYDVTTLTKHQGAFDVIKEAVPDMIICDLMFGAVPAGWALVDMLYLDPETRPIPLILCTVASKEVQEALPSLQSKGILWLEKPFELEALLDMLGRIDRNTMAGAKARAG